jgi:hypothetical protein
MAEAILDVTDNGFSPPRAAHRRGVPRITLIDRLHGRGAVKEQIHPHRRLSKSQEDRLAFWILRQESLGYAPPYSQVRACVNVVHHLVGHITYSATFPHYPTSNPYNLPKNTLN